jgi:hypothetical protein
MRQGEPFTPVEYLGFWVRWISNNIARSLQRKFKVSFNDFKKQRMGFFDVIIGLVTLLVLASLLFVLFRK